jgi:hypothetical protein
MPITNEARSTGEAVTAEYPWRLTRPTMASPMKG